MKKRSAMLVAAGLVAALLAGGAALSFSLSGGTAAAQDAGRMKPIVKTERRTVTIHKQAKTKPAEVVTISAGSTSGSSAGAPSSTQSDDTYAEDSSHDDDDAYEVEDEIEDEAEHETESHDEGVEFESGDDHSGSGESGGDD